MEDAGPMIPEGYSELNRLDQHYGLLWARKIIFQVKPSLRFDNLRTLPVGSPAALLDWCYLPLHYRSCKYPSKPRFCTYHAPLHMPFLQDYLTLLKIHVCSI